MGRRIGRARKSFRSHLAKRIETEAVDTTPPRLIEDDAPILRRDGISRLHGAHVAFFDGKKRRERRDSDFVDDFFERRHSQSLRQVATRVKTARSDFVDTLRSMTRENFLAEKILLKNRYMAC